MQQWIPDILGDGFEQCTLELDGGALATLVRCNTAGTRPDSGAGAGTGPDSSASAAGAAWEGPDVDGPLFDVDVLYVHGWSDYFFQKNLATFWNRAGARFFALDLRNYGRSLRPGLVPGFVTELSTYDEDIAAALDAMGRTAESTRPLVLLGHSTGGLTLSLWAARHPGMASALILNSPWLEFQATELGRRAIAPLLGLRARLHPLVPLPAVDPGNYTRAVSAAMDGEWDYDPQWRPDRGFPVTPAFLAAVFTGQATLAAGLGLTIPALVMLSDKSYLQPRWSADALTADVALNVDVVAQRAPSLGSDVTVARIPDAFHDVFLSPAGVRLQAFERMGRWLPGALQEADPRRWEARLSGL